MAERIAPRNVADLFRQAASRYADLPAFATKQPDGQFSSKSFSQLYDEAIDLATGLVELGVGQRHHVGLLADNRYEWILTDCALQLCGAVDVPRGTDITPSEVQYILDHADCEVAVVENLGMVENVRSCNLPRLRVLIVMEDREALPEGVLSLQAVAAAGRRLREGGDRTVEERIEAIASEDLFTMIYTSGTTGTPKGVQLTHAAMVSQIRNLPFPLYAGDRALSLLPIWHSYERVFEMLTISSGMCTHYTSIRNLAVDLPIVRPNFMVSTPRLWESLYLKIQAKVDASPPFRRKLFELARLSTEKVHRAERFFVGQQLDTTGRSLWENFRWALYHLVGWVLFQIPYRILDPIVLKKLRQIVGGEFRGTISGGGALQPHVDSFFNFIGIPVLEGYGLTEAAPVLAVRTFDNLVIGTVGAPYPGTEIRIVSLEDGSILYPNPKHPGGGRGLRGEIHARGPQVMKGYYKDPDATSRVLRDGWLNTGDIGMMTFNNCLKILGRSKDTIVLQSGENVEPVPIEGRLAQSPFIDQCMVVGQDQKYLGVLIVPAMAAFPSAGSDGKVSPDVLASQEACSLVEQEIRNLISAKSGFKPFERIATWRFVPKPFEIGDEMTATLKLKRHVIHAKYDSLIKEMFDEARG